MVFWFTWKPNVLGIGIPETLGISDIFCISELLGLRFQWFWYFLSLVTLNLLSPYHLGIPVRIDIPDMLGIHNTK